MVLYRPGGFTQMTLDEPYRMRGWTQSWGCSGTQYRYGTPSGWKCDPSYPEVNGGVGTHGGCSYCLMIELQVVANYQTEATFVSNPHGAQIFIDGIEWFPGAVTASDGATFRGISPGTHTYELRMAGYQSATGTFGLELNTPVIVTGNLVPPCIPNWQCEQPLNDYEADGCGNRRANPACAPPQTGSISFTSIPSGVEIFINGADQGVVTPNTVTNVPAGDHTYVLKLAGYNDYSGTVSVVSGQTASVSATLTPAYREAALVSCSFPANAIAGQTYQGTITVNQGSMTENYKLVFSGDLAGESTQFTVNAGTGQQQITVGSMVFTTGGPKTVTAALVKI